MKGTSQVIYLNFSTHKLVSPSIDFEIKIVFLTLLEDSGLGSIDLSTSTNSVTTLEDYAKPLVSYVRNLPDDEKAMILAFFVWPILCCLLSNSSYQD